jgi:hypothetical protein
MAFIVSINTDRVKSKGILGRFTDSSFTTIGNLIICNDNYLRNLGTEKLAYIDVAAPLTSRSIASPNMALL